MKFLLQMLCILLLISHSSYSQWFQQTPGTTETLRGVAFTDENMSTPSGELTKSMAFSDICFVDENTTNPNNI